jgi:DNA polymerase-3 subunit beta
MKFIVSSSALLRQLQAVQGVIQTNNVLPILDHYLFEVEWAAIDDLYNRSKYDDADPSCG